MTVGKATYVNYSGVTINDYCICSASFLENITSFHVGDFDPNLSDHCHITVKILSWSVHNESELGLRPKPINIKWSKSVEEQFTLIVSILFYIRHHVMAYFALFCFLIFAKQHF
jgi:hypothetical protein